MYSYTSSLGATGLSVGLPSVPNDRTEKISVTHLLIRTKIHDKK